MITLRQMTPLLTALLVSSVARAGFTVDYAYTVYSDGLYGEATNGSFTFTYDGPPFTVGDITFAGEVTSLGIVSFLSELQVWIVDPQGNVAGWSPVSGLTWTGTHTVEAQTVIGGQTYWAGMPGEWTFIFSERYDDAGLDAAWSNLTITVHDLPPSRATYEVDLTGAPLGFRPQPDLYPLGILPPIAAQGFATQAPYHAQPLSVTVAGDYTIGSRQTDFDGLLYLYAGTYNAAVCYENVAAANDDGPAGMGTSQLADVALTPGTAYTLLTVGFAPGDVGPFVNRIDGPGPVILGPPACLGDADCSGWVDWRDIDYFVAGMNDNESAWVAMFAPAEPTCPFANLDVNANGYVDWRDIDPFVAVQNTTCP